MKVSIDRYDPDTKEKKTDVFMLDDEICQGMTVMSLLNYLSVHCDTTIAYYHHSVCDHGICGRCSLLVNERVKLACVTAVADYEELRLGPVPGRRIVRDLVTI
ncbi:MAG: succinate dehydrogenase [Clostridiales bacterium]|nr:succinate dehydrogenase [Clostridiales bacterium]